MLAQILSGAGLAAGITVGALLAEQMLGSSSLSGLPTVFFTIGSGRCGRWARASQSALRPSRVGLSAGYLAGAVGSLGVVVAASLGSVVLLFASLLVYGAGAATNLQARYAGADLAAPSRRGRAVSIVLVGNGRRCDSWSQLGHGYGRCGPQRRLPSLGGSVHACHGRVRLGCALVLWLLLRARPAAAGTKPCSGRDIKERDVTTETPPAAAGRRWSWALASGAGIMIITQLIMVAIMTMTPIHIEHHGHGIGITGIVIGAHVAGMFLPSPLSGWLVDRFGYLSISVAAGVTLLAAGLFAAWAPVDSVAMLVLALVLLGLGWNLGLVSGTTLVTDAVPLATRARTQGVVDLGIALAGAAAGLSSGLIFAATSYATLALAGGLLALVIIPIAAVARAAPSPPSAQT